MECKKGLKTKEEIFLEFGKDDMQGCENCGNLVYKQGMLQCKKIEEGDEDAN